MAFVQIIEMTTSNEDELRRLGDEWEQRIGGDTKARRRVLCRDRNNPSRFVNIVFFDSYEEAMENSDNPATSEMAGKMAALLDAPATFHDLDVMEDRALGG